MQFDIRECRWSDLYPDCVPLMEAHRIELSHAHRPFKLALSMIEGMEANGTIKFWGAWASNKGLIGYAVWYLMPEIDSEDTLCALHGPWYVRREWRNSGVGARLWTQSLSGLRRLGVKDVLPHHDGADSMGLSYFYRRIGAVPYETAYLLKLDED